MQIILVYGKALTSITIVLSIKMIKKIPKIFVLTLAIIIISVGVSALVCEQPLKDGKPYIYGKTYKQGGYTELWIAVCGDSDGICPEDFEFYCPDDDTWQTIDCGSFSDPDCEQLQGCSQYNDWVKATIDHRPCTTNLEGCVRDSDGDNFYDQYCQDNEIKPIELVFIA